MKFSADKCKASGEKKIKNPNYVFMMSNTDLEVTAMERSVLEIISLVGRGSPKRSLQNVGHLKERKQGQNISSHFPTV